jgi:hypothetical protein
MNFYLEDDDEDGAADPSQSQLFSQTTAASQGTSWQCSECGGADWYIDTATGNHHCSSCFSQAVSQSQTDQGLEYDEVVMMAAKRQSGALVQSKKRPRRSYAAHTNKKLSVDALNQTVTLPDLAHCIDGLQTVLQAWSRSLVELVLPTDTATVHSANHASDRAQVLEEAVGALWKAYLRAWADGAAHYAALSPGTRFSLRDCFLSTKHVDLIYRHLSYQVTDTAAKTTASDSDKLDATIARNDDSDSVRSRNLMDSSSSDDDSYSDSDIATKRTNKKTPIKTYRHQGMIAHCIRQYCTRKRKGRMEVALSLQPNMPFCAALLWLAANRLYGLDGRQFATWMEAGALPVLNSFALLSSQQQDVLRPIVSHFTMSAVPSIGTLENQATLVAVACGLESVSDWNGTTELLSSNGTDTESTAKKSVKQTVVTQKVKKREAANDFKAEKMLFMTPDSVPVTAAQLVADTGLGQTVLDWTLALMGCVQGTPDQLRKIESLLEKQEQRQSNKKEEPRQPGKSGRRSRSELLQKQNIQVATLPWPAAGPVNLTSLPHVCAVIVYACQLCPDWHTWSYHRRTTVNATSENSRHRRERIVPQNLEQFNLLGNGASLEGYLEFYEETVDNPNERLAPDFLDLLDTTTASHSQLTITDDDDQYVDRVVRPCTLLAGPSKQQQSVAAFQPGVKTQEQHLLIEFLAYTMRVDPDRIVDAFMEIFK